MDQAVNNNWLSEDIFAWNPSSGAYDVLTGDASLINPWTGYWVMAQAPVTLIFQPALFPESSVTAP